MNEPKLRFKTDDGSQFPDWKEKKLSEMFKKIIEKNRLDLPPLTIVQGYGTIRRDEAERRITYDEKGLKNYKAVQKDDFIVHLRSFEGGLEIANQDGIVSPAYHVYRGNDEIYPSFYYPYFRSASFIKGKLAICVTGVRDGKNIEMGSFDELLLPYPCFAEQQKIAEFLSTIDMVIEKQKETVSAWEERKKGVMQKLFSKEARFKTNDGSDYPEWEEKKLGDHVQFINGRAYKQDELHASGKYLVLRVGNLFTNDSYYYSDLELNDDKYIEDGNLIYAWSATFGPRIYHGEKCIYHYHIWKLKFDENAISKMFLNYQLLYDVENIKSQRTGGTMVHITKNAMENRKLQFPCIAEQQKIADCLSSLDDVIDKQNAILAAWENLKKGLLQQMFV